MSDVLASFPFRSQFPYLSHQNFLSHRIRLAFFGQRHPVLFMSGASSKAINKAPSTSRCSSQQFEKRFVQSIMELLDSLETPAQSGHGRTQGCLRVLFASFNHRLIDQLTMELGRRQGGSAPSLVQGKKRLNAARKSFEGIFFDSRGLGIEPI